METDSIHIRLSLLLFPGAYPFFVRINIVANLNGYEWSLFPCKLSQLILYDYLCMLHQYGAQYKS